MIWILVAHRADARIFKTSGRPGKIELVREFDYPEGRRQNREIDTDSKGSRYGSVAGRGNTNHGSHPSGQQKGGLDPQTESAEHVADVFAKELAVILRDGRVHNEFNELIVVAEAGFLGKLGKFIDKDTERLITQRVNRNFTGQPMPKLVEHLDELVHETRKIA